MLNKFGLCLIFLFSAPCYASGWVCTHPQVCEVIESYFKSLEVEAPSLTKAIASSGDPHEIEPNSAELKRLYKAQTLISAPSELHPWIIPILEMRQKHKNIKSFQYKIPEKLTEEYPNASNEALAHFWLYPKIKCDFFQKIGQWVSHDQTQKQPPCPFENEADFLKHINKELPIVVSHDAIVPLLKSYGFTVFSIKGSGHHEEPSPKQLKNIQDILKLHPKVIWIVEEQIHFPQSIRKLRRKNDTVLSIDTNKDYPSTGASALEELKNLLQKI